jgi:gamma-glutamyl phosphate reductase
MYADGVCHVFVDKDANMKKAQQIVADAKLDYPAACNAMASVNFIYYVQMSSKEKFPGSLFLSQETS